MNEFIKIAQIFDAAGYKVDHFELKYNDEVLYFCMSKMVKGIDSVPPPSELVKTLASAGYNVETFKDSFYPKDYPKQVLEVNISNPR